ncbi:MAG: hypothetical protein AAFX06_12685 [Planctomycetota bacterium]
MTSDSGHRYGSKVMAVYMNLAVDCADEPSTAESLVRVFSRLRLRTGRFGETGCEVEHIRPLHTWGRPDRESEDGAPWHTVCISPSEIGNGLPLDRELVDELRPQLYEPLRDGFRFRSAWFGWEAQDVLGESDWLTTLDETVAYGQSPGLPGLIVAERIFKEVELENWKPFCPGFLWCEPEAEVPN